MIIWASFIIGTVFCRNGLQALPNLVVPITHPRRQRKYIKIYISNYDTYNFSLGTLRDLLATIVRVDIRRDIHSFPLEFIAGVITTPSPFHLV